MMMSFKDHIRRTIVLALPVSASQVSDMLVLTADAVMVGALGATALAGVTLAGSASMIALLFGVGFTAAITPLAGEAYGRQNIEDVVRYARAGTLVSVIISSIIIAALLLLSPHLSLLGSPKDVTEAAIPFFRWIVASFIFRILFGSFKQTAEAMSNTRAALLINLGTNILNVMLCWVFIYGHLGAPAMGAEGAGVATFLARAAAVVAAWLVFARTSFFVGIRTELKRQRRERIHIGTYMKEIMHVGTGISLQIVVEVMAFATGAIMMGWLGATALAAHQVSMNPASITFMAALGLGSAVTIRVSNLRGEGRHHDARIAAYTGLFLVVVYMLVVAALYVLLRYQIPLFYVNDPAVIDLAATLLLFAGAFSLFDGLQVVGLGVLRGYADIKVPTIIATVSYIAIMMPCSYLLAFKFGFGAPGIWMGYLVGLVVASAAYMVRIYKL